MYEDFSSSPPRQNWQHNRNHFANRKYYNTQPQSLQAFNFVMVSLSEVPSTIESDLQIFDLFDISSGIRLIGYCIPIFVYRKNWIPEPPKHRQLRRTQSNCFAEPHFKLQQYLGRDAVPVVPKYPVNWLKYVISGCPSVYSYPATSHATVSVTLYDHIHPSPSGVPFKAAGDVYKLRECGYLVDFRLFDMSQCFMLIFTEPVAND
uniref:ZP domain-containing protein n=1 Tax=Rhabditophanes sp. KR3021 TaxID=114890 RepID=A0AC35U0J0_9BILA